MKAEAMSFTFLGNEGVVKIPFFQRGYVWKKNNWEDLLIDLLDDRKNHFLGSLILKQQEKQTGKPKEVVVIDGQQRLTTLSVLIKALYDLFPEDTKNNCENSIKTYLFYKQQQTDKKFHVKIQHSKLDSQYYHQVIDPGIDPQELSVITDSSSKILQCYKYFYEELQKHPQAELESLFNRIFDTENKILVIIDLGEKEDEQAIFDTINSAGVRLSAADIIKNSLFQRALDVFESQDDVHMMYQNDWEAVFASDDDATAFWDSQRSTGRLMRDNIEILLHSIAVIKGFFDPDKDTLSGLSSLYKAEIAKKTKYELQSFISDIKEYAQLYRNKISSFNRTTLFSFSDDLQRLLHILYVLEITTFHPFILCALKKHKADGPLLNETLKKLEKFIMRRMIAKSETKSYNKFCKELIVDETLLDTKLSEVDDNAVIGGLQNIANKYAALILFWIELYRRDNDKKFPIKDLKFCYSLEHVMPQKWEEHWSIVPVRNDDGTTIIDTEQAKRIRVSKIYSIGNMTLLTSSLNSALRNYPFEKKVLGEGKKKGIKSYADLSVTKDDIVDVFDGGDRIWDEIKIQNRTIALTKEILALWSFPNSFSAKT